MGRLQLIVIPLACVFLAPAWLVSLTSSAGVYNPWYDLDDNGKIDIFDVVRMAGSYGTTGTPYEAKAALEYDSGWINITDKAGRYFNVTHNLDSTDIMVDIQGKTTADGGPHQRHLGGAGLTSGWNKTLGGTNDDMSSRSVIQTSDGGYALAGYTRSFGTGGSDFWLVKTDVSGNRLWNKTYGGPGDEICDSVVATADGGYALGGITQSFGAGGNDFWLVKTDSTGNMQWNKTYGGPGDEGFALSLVQTSDGGYALVGMTKSFGAGDYDFWLVKTDVSGNRLWNKTYGGMGSDRAGSVVQTSDGGYALSGPSDSFGAGGSDFWLVKTDAAGNMQWNKTYGGTGDDSGAWGMVQTNDGGYALFGTTESFGAGSADFWLVKTDAAGNMQWNKTYGGPVYEGANFIAQTKDSGYIMLGFTDSFGAGGLDFWLVKTDAAGNMQWNKTYGGPAIEHGRSLVQTSDGGYALVGMTSSFGAGGYDVWLIKIDAAGNARDGFRYGLAWVDSATNTITLYRGTDDNYWNYVHVRIWKIHDTP